MSSHLEELIQEGWEQIKIQVKGKTVVAYKTPPVNGIRRTIKESRHLKEGERHLAGILFPKSKANRILKSSSYSTSPTPLTSSTPSTSHTPSTSPKPSTSHAPLTSQAPAQSTEITPKRSCPETFAHLAERGETSKNEASVKRLGKIFNVFFYSHILITRVNQENYNINMKK